MQPSPSRTPFADLVKGALGVDATDVQSIWWAPGAKRIASFDTLQRDWVASYSSSAVRALASCRWRHLAEPDNTRRAEYEAMLHSQLSAIHAAMSANQPPSREQVHEFALLGWLSAASLTLQHKSVGGLYQLAAILFAQLQLPHETKEAKVVSEAGLLRFALIAHRVGELLDTVLAIDSDDERSAWREWTADKSELLPHVQLTLVLAYLYLKRHEGADARGSLQSVLLAGDGTSHWLPVPQRTGRVLELLTGGCASLSSARLRHVLDTPAGQAFFDDVKGGAPAAPAPLVALLRDDDGLNVNGQQSFFPTPLTNPARWFHVNPAAAAAAVAASAAAAFGAPAVVTTNVPVSSFASTGPPLGSNLLPNRPSQTPAAAPASAAFGAPAVVTRSAPAKSSASTGLPSGSKQPVTITSRTPGFWSFGTSLAQVPNTSTAAAAGSSVNPSAASALSLGLLAFDQSEPAAASSAAPPAGAGAPAVNDPLAALGLASTGDAQRAGAAAALPTSVNPPTPGSGIELADDNF